MTEFKEVMKSAVLDYITNNSGNIDYVDIGYHFALKAEIAMCVATELIDDNRVKRVWNGRHYMFEVIL